MQPAAESILSADAVEASSRSLEALSRHGGEARSPGATRSKGMVREMLRPMLREWLDAHLPDIVETMVAKDRADSGRGH